MISGVYLIINTVNGKLYVGSAANIYSRVEWHRRFLELGKHHSILLQRSYDKYGFDAFDYVIVEVVSDLKVRLKIEQLWMDASKCYEPEFGYNIFKVAGSPQGYKHSEEWKRANSERMKGRKWSNEAKIKMSIVQKNRSQEWRANHSAAMKKRVFSEQHKKRLTDANKRRGKSYLTDEIRKRMSESQKARAKREGRNKN